MRVTVDGKVQFDGRADLGSDYSFQASEQIEILVGNAAALRVNYNQRDLGLMGNFGQVIDRLYTATGDRHSHRHPAAHTDAHAECHGYALSHAYCHARQLRIRPRLEDNFVG